MAKHKPGAELPTDQESNPQSGSPLVTPRLAPPIEDTFWECFTDLVTTDFVAGHALESPWPPLIFQDLESDMHRSEVHDLQAELNEFKARFAAKGNGRPATITSLAKFCDTAMPMLNRIARWEKRRNDPRNVSISYFDVATQALDAGAIVRAFHAQAERLRVEAVPVFPLGDVTVHDAIAWMGSLRKVCRSGAMNEHDTAANQSVPAIARALALYTHGVSEIKILRAAEILQDRRLTVDEKLNRLNENLKLPPVSGEKIGSALGVTKQAVLATEWWRRNRAGESDRAVGRRVAKHSERAKQYQTHDDDRARDDGGN